MESDSGDMWDKSAGGHGKTGNGLPLDSLNFVAGSFLQMPGTNI